MKLRKIALPVIMLMLVLVCTHAGASAGEGTSVSAETQERLMEQYGLEQPAPVLPEWNGDIGVSSPVNFIQMICRFIVNPLVFIIHELL